MSNNAALPLTNSQNEESDNEYDIRYIALYAPQRHNAHMIEIDYLWKQIIHKQSSYELRAALQDIVDRLFLNPPSQSPTRLHDFETLTLISSGTMMNVYMSPQRNDRVIRISRQHITKVDGSFILCKLVLEIILMKYMSMFMPRHVPDVHSFGFLMSGAFYTEVDRIKNFDHREEEYFSEFQKATKQYILAFLNTYGLRMLDYNNPTNWACTGNEELFVLDLNDVDVLPILS